MDSKQGGLGRLIRWLGYEFYLSYKFIESDTNAIFMSPAAAIGSCITLNKLDTIWSTLIFSAASSWLLLYSHAVGNQYEGYEEDCLNKKGRPLPRKLVTMESMPKRIVLVAMAWNLFGWYFGTSTFTIGWSIT